MVVDTGQHHLSAAGSCEGEREKGGERDPVRRCPTSSDQSRTADAHLQVKRSRCKQVRARWQEMPAGKSIHRMDRWMLAQAVRYCCPDPIS
jgi:hypothetical protein